MKRFGLIVLACAALLSTGIVYAGYDEDDDDDNTFSMHGEVRFRAELWNNLWDYTDTLNPMPNPPNSKEEDDDFDLFPYRVRFGAKGNLGSGIIVYGEFQGSGVMGGDHATRPFFGVANEEDPNNTLDNGLSDVDLYRGWIKIEDLGDTAVDLKIGRQEIKFDTGLHFSNLPFYNGIVHDAFMASYQVNSLEFDLFWARNVEANLNTTFVNTNNGQDVDTLGFHGSIDLSDDDEFETNDVGYYVFFETMNSAELGAGGGHPSDRGKLYTIGGRWGRYVEDEDAFFWNVEAAFQTGDFAPCAVPWRPNYMLAWMPPATCGTFTRTPTLDQSAYVFEGAFGFQWAGDMTHKIWGGVTMASGDDDPNDMDQEAFIPLYTDFHKRLGYADQYQVSNIMGLAVGYKGSLNDHRHVYGATFWKFEKMEEKGTVFSPITTAYIDCDPPGALTQSACQSDLGWELDLFYNLNMTENLAIETALAWVEPGDAVTDHFSDFGQTVGMEDYGDNSAYRLTVQARARF